MSKRRAIARPTRRLIQARAGHRCEYCLHPDSHACAPFACEHVLPRIAGAGDTTNELAWACPLCNGHKHTKTHARDPRTNRLVPLFNPRRQKWRVHFAWSADYETVVGRTATGRATVAALQLNQAEHINLRRALLAIGLHPPSTK